MTFLGKFPRRRNRSDLTEPFSDDEFSDLRLETSVELGVLTNSSEDPCEPARWARSSSDLEVEMGVMEVVMKV